MLEMLEADEVAGPLSDPAFLDPGHRAKNYGEVWRALKRLAEKHDADELYRLGQSAGLPWGVIRSPDEVLDDLHLAARGHFVALPHPELDRTVTYPGAPFLASGSPWVMNRRPPLLGEHTAEVAAEWSTRP
jgi:crotonobetainyl-CoA:carnitine CoA-transferase CaiB-like acyl-CoA transferase